MSLPELKVRRLPERFVSDDTRVIARFFDPGGDARTHSLVDRVMSLTPNPPFPSLHLETADVAFASRGFAYGLSSSSS